MSRFLERLSYAVTDQHELGLDERRDFCLQLPIPHSGLDTPNKRERVARVIRRRVWLMARQKGPRSLDLGAHSLGLRPERFAYNRPEIRMQRTPLLKRPAKDRSLVQVSSEPSP